MTVRYCDRCGLPLAADALFCASCGAPRAADPAATGAPSAAAPVQPAPPVQPTPPPVSMSAPPSRPAPPPVSMSAPPVRPAPSWPAASPGAPAGWNPTPPPRKRGRGCGCLLVPAVLALAALAGLAAIGGAFDGPAAGDGAGVTADLPPATTPLAGTITPGAAEVIGIQTSDPASDVTLTAPPDGPVPGLRLEIPAAAYAAPVEFAVSARPVTVTGYDGKVTALSDLITVENGGAYAATTMTVTVPVTIPDGMFAMGFFRHDDGGLEAMPLVDETPTSVTVATRHFSSFLVLAVAEAALPDNIGTGFRAHEDDFQAPNYGSFYAPNGHCAGQSMAAIWYFLERKSRGAPDLWGLTDNDGREPTLAFWQDDATQFHLASSVQRDADWTALSARIAVMGVKADADRLQWDAFRYAMLVTGQPQLVVLYQTDAVGGHAIVAYAATPSGLWVADPNFPGKLRHIAWNAAAGRFDPYASGPTAAESDHLYDLIGLVAQSAVIDWDAIGARWAEVDKGNVGRDRFPRFAVEREIIEPDGTIRYEPLKSGPIPTRTPVLTFSGIKGAPLRATFYDGTRPIVTVQADHVKPVPLRAGVNDLGVYIEALIGTEWEYLDFYRFDLVAPGTPSPAATEPPEPEPTYDCSNKPSGGIGGLDWSLHCESIQTIQP